MRARPETRRISPASPSAMVGGSGQRAAKARTSRSICGQGRENERERPHRLAQRRQRAAEIRHQPGHLGPARTGEHDDQRRRGCWPARLVRVWPQVAEPLDQRMADIDAARAAQPPVGLGLERQQRQHAIDISEHRLGAAGPPGPDAGTDVIHDRQFRQRRPHATGDAVGEVGAVDDDEARRA